MLCHDTWCNLALCFSYIILCKVIVDVLCVVCITLVYAFALILYTDAYTGCMLEVYSNILSYNGMAPYYVLLVE